MNGNGPRYDCAVDVAMSVIEGRWKTTILCILAKEGGMRLSALQRRIGAVTPRILSKQLKELESDGMVRREATSEGGTTVTYYITDKGASIGPILAQLAAWGMENQMVSVIVPDEEERIRRRSLERRSDAPSSPLSAAIFSHLAASESSLPVPYPSR